MTNIAKKSTLKQKHTKKTCLPPFCQMSSHTQILLQPFNVGASGFNSALSQSLFCLLEPGASPDCRSLMQWTACTVSEWAELACGWQPWVWDTGEGKQWLWCFEFDCSNSFGHILTYRTFYNSKIVFFNEWISYSTLKKLHDDFCHICSLIL